jgi:hypothetical protein
LPRRLGDDPLTRARKKTTRLASDGSIPLHGKHNDVFFQRRTEETDSATTRKSMQVSLVPEISEISEAPEIREVAAVQDVHAERSVAAIVELNHVPVADLNVEVPRVLAVSPLEKVVTVESGTPAGESWARESAVPETEKDPVGLPAASQPSDERKGHLEPEPKKSGGFFRRLFSRFEK